MRKLKALRAFINSLGLVKTNNIESYPVIDDFVPVFEYIVNADSTVLCAYDQVYTAVINLEKYPHLKYDENDIFSRLVSWLGTYDPLQYRLKIERGNNNEFLPLDKMDLNIDLPLIQDDFASLEILLPFREPVFWIADAAGIYEYEGQKFRLANGDNPVENFERDYIVGRQ
jgi:hypothetical protein